MSRDLSRRRFLSGAAAIGGGALLAGCYPTADPDVHTVLKVGEDLTEATQRFFLKPTSLAREFTEADISPKFRANGTRMPDSPEYAALAANDFADWRLEVGGLVENPATYSLADLRAMPSRTQITRHDCVEGWTCIGKWKGVPLAQILNAARLKPEAKFVVFTCADELVKTLDGTGRYYESHGLEDAFHPQTILAYEMNDRPLPIEHGAPLRLRAERMLGYKMPKYIMKVEAVDSLAPFGRGKGGFWEDYADYEWYAGI
ncbi:MAG TPA: molybdopterin-binding protein [Bauldia sp.]|nr:molybdopterin-binding protein [Bauldia sp.]